MKNNQIYFNIKDDKITIKSRGPVNFEEMTQILFTGLLGAMNQIVAHTPEEHREATKGQVYDTVNLAASKTLEMFAPEYELNPDLTAKAMMEVENTYISREYAKLKEKNKNKNKNKTEV